MRATPSQARKAVGQLLIPWDPSIKDPRFNINQSHPHPCILAILAASFACGRAPLRQVVDFSEDLRTGARRRLGLTEKKISYSVFYSLLGRQDPTGFRETVQAQVQHFIRHGLVRPDLFALGVLSFDGKMFFNSNTTTVEGAKVSTQESSGVVTSSMMSLRAVLTSSQVRPCLDLEFIGEKTGEAPAFRLMFPRVVAEFSEFFEIVTGDAGLLCRENAELIVKAVKEYVFSLKGNQPSLEEAAQKLFQKAPNPAWAETIENRDGGLLVRQLEGIEIPEGSMDFPGARMVWRVRQTSLLKGEAEKEEIRYFITSLTFQRITVEQALKLVRLHWGIENNHNWTMDMPLSEDDVQPCQQSREALEVVSWLRVLGYNLLAAVRAGQPLCNKLPTPWKRCMDLLRDAFCCCDTRLLRLQLGFG